MTVPTRTRVTAEQMAARLGLRPLSARSVVASVLMGARDRGLPAGVLVRVTGLLGVSEGATRVALSRMSADAEVTARDGRYSLSGPLAEFQARLVVRSRPELRPWDGTWRLWVVTRGGRTQEERQAFRKAAQGVRLAELAVGSWIRPDNVAGGLNRADANLVAAQCEGFSVTPDEPAAALAARLWDLTGWANRARAVVAALDDLYEDLQTENPDALAPGMVAAAAAVRHASEDPLLPEALRPARWPSDDLRETLDRHDTVWQALLRRRIHERGRS